MRTDKEIKSCTNGLIQPHSNGADGMHSGSVARYTKIEGR